MLEKLHDYPMSESKMKCYKCNSKLIDGSCKMICPIVAIRWIVVICKLLIQGTTLISQFVIIYPLILPSTIISMKSAQINEYGSSDVIEINQNTPEPSLSPGKVLVAIKAAGVNPVDWKISEGDFQQMFPLQFPSTLGIDFSGVIKQVGEDVSPRSEEHTSELQSPYELVCRLLLE